MNDAVQGMCIRIYIRGDLRIRETRQLTLLLQYYIIPVALLYFAQGCGIGCMLLERVASGCRHIINKGIMGTICQLGYLRGKVIHCSIAVTDKQYT
ncbi:hypothetical protein D9M68_896230 [compost metagenome]